jgi:hypothetical protein
MFAKSSSARSTSGRMLRLALFTILVALVSLWRVPANASTFVITGASAAPPFAPTQLTGTMEVDVVGGTITSADFFAPDLGTNEFTNIYFSSASGSNWELKVADTPLPLPPGFQIDLVFTPSFDATHTAGSSDLIGFTGGSIVSWIETGGPPTDCALSSCVLNGTTGTIDPATPLPAALPLFATSLGALGLLGWRRKRKAQAV